MTVAFLLLVLQYGTLTRILGELKYKLQDGQKIKISVGIKLDLLPHLNHKKPYLGFGQLEVW
jgi:hypothetical protein